MSAIALLKEASLLSPKATALSMVTEALSGHTLHPFLDDACRILPPL